MELTRYVDSLQQQLAVAAAAGGPEAEAVAERLAAPLDSAVRLTLQEAVVDAAAEITLALAPASVDVRLAGRGLAFVVSGAPEATTPVTSSVTPSRTTEEGDEGGTSRITFRPSDRLKADIESAAEREGLSVNAFLVRTLTLVVRPSGPSASTASSPSGPVTTPQGGQRLSGWVQ
ncbi:MULTISPECIES: histidine kinase [unclassified Knoellia]|uniref:histidine kinase n=1 Tax=Knoellia altitudinis TaxID=3404795 RepID=UPI00360AC234